jgi:ankyrin repeat protein
MRHSGERMTHVVRRANRPKVTGTDAPLPAQATDHRSPYVVLMMTMMLAVLLANQDSFLKAVADRDADSVRTMLAGDPSLANAKNSKGSSAVIAALFAIRKGEEAFPEPATNATLQAILAAKPQLDVYETAAVGTAPQLEAMLRGDAEALKRPNAFGWTLLHLAAYAGNAGTTELLIRKGADVNVRALSKFRNTPLQTALLTGQFATAKLLLEHGADVLVRQAKGFTPMHEAALLGRADLIERLLAHGAEINSMADNGHTPLAEAIRGHRDNLVALMKSKGATLAPTPNEE